MVSEQPTIKGKLARIDGWFATKLGKWVVVVRSDNGEGPDLFLSAHKNWVKGARRAAFFPTDTQAQAFIEICCDPPLTLEEREALEVEGW